MKSEVKDFLVLKNMKQNNVKPSFYEVVFSFIIIENHNKILIQILLIPFY